MSSPSRPITTLLRAWGGQEAALEQLMPLVYDDLRRLAHHYMARERPGTLQTTAHVNETYLRLIDIHGIRWQDRAHFMAMCARLMRRVLVDDARSRACGKRGGGAEQVPFDESAVASREAGPALIAVDDALRGLAEIDARKSRVVELKFFGGLSVKETATVLNVSPETVLRDWRLAKAWLARELNARLNGDA